MRFRLISLLLGLACLASTASAATYYVRTDGNDANAGTGSSAAQAWATVIAAATKSLSPGDVVYIQAGTYLGPIEPTVDGALGNPITFIADRSGSVAGWSSGDVIIQAPVGQHALHVSFDDYLTFSDFLLEGDPGQDTVDVDNGTGTVLQRCEIYGGFIGFDIDDADATIVNCLVRDNTNDGINLDTGNLVVRNSTVVNNADDGVYLFAGTLTVTNCIIANHGRYGLAVSSGTMTHTYNLAYGSGNSDFSGATQHATEIVADPQFASATDYHITMLSPARNAGTDLSGTVDDDLDGLPRPINGAYDIGCYEEGPVGHWKLNETSGTTAADDSGLGADGTYVNGPVLGGSGPHGNSVEFNLSDTDDRVDIPHTVLDGAMDASVSFWIKTTHTGAAAVLSGANASQHNEFLVFFTSNTSIALYKNGVARSFGVTSVADDQWHHFVFTWDGDANLVTLYLDGELVGSGTIAGATGLPLVIDPGGLLLGQDQDTVGGSFDPFQTFRGLLDEVRIYNRTLSAPEIMELYGLTGHWKLDETSGTVAADSSGLGRDGTYTNGPTLGDDATYGKGATFNGTSQYALIPDDSAFSSHTTTGLTVSAWVKVLNYNTDGHVQTRQAVVSKVTGGNVEWTLHLHDDGQVDFNTWSAGNSQITYVRGGSLAIGRWAHVAATYEHGVVARLYIDGEEVHSNTSFAFPSVDKDAEVRIGSRGDGQFLNATIDEVRIYNRALSASEIKGLYGLMGHWRLDETAGVIAADSSGLGNDGSYEGTPTLGVQAIYDKGFDADYTDGYDYVEIPNSPSLENVQEESYSISVWFRPGSVPPGNGGTGDNDGNYGIVIKPGFHIGLFYSSTNRFRFGHWIEGNIWQGLGWNAPDEFDPERFYHLVGIVDRTAGLTKIYVDGELIDSTAFTPGTASIEHGTVPWRIGVGGPLQATYSWPSDGVLDDVRIYNRALTEKQVAEIHGLMGHWKLDETAGIVAADATAFGHDGTYVNGPVLNLSGKVDTAVNFDGTNDRVEVGAIDVPGSTMTISAWIKADSYHPTGTHIVAKANGSGLSNNWWSLTTYNAGGGINRLGMLFKTTTLGTQFLAASSGDLPTGVWIHVAAVYDGSSMELYKNGVLVDSLAASGNIATDSTVPMWISASPSSEKFFNGLVDDVRIYNRPLLTEEVQDLANGGVNGIRIIKWVESPNL